MRKNTELLNHLYENVSMGHFTMEELLNDLKDLENKIKPLLEEMDKDYERYKKKVEKASKEDLKDLNVIAKMGSSMSIKMKVGKDNSDAKMAEILIQGISMGTSEIESKIKSYKDADPNILELAKDYLEVLNKQIKELKEYL